MNVVEPPQPATAQAAPTSASSIRRRIAALTLQPVLKPARRLQEFGARRGTRADPGCVYIAATPNPRATTSAERGNQVPGASPVVDPREAQALSAPARQLTPQADERERAGTPPDNSDYRRADGAGCVLERVCRRQREPERLRELRRRELGSS